MGGVHPSVKDPAGKKIFDIPVGLFFVILFAKSHPCLLTKPPAEKNFHTPVEKKFWPPKAAAKFFLDTPPVYTPPLSQNPDPPMYIMKVINCSFSFLIDL